MGIKNSFAKVPNNRLTRNFGGTVAGVADPYLTGYHFVYFAGIPTALPQYADDIRAADIGNILAASCKNFLEKGD